MEYKRGQFKINGLHSEEFDTFITDRPERISAGRVVELRPREGNDSVAIDFAYYRNVEWTIKCYAKASSLDQVAHLEDRIKSWLDMRDYSDCIFYFDEHYIYQAIVVSPPKFNGARRNGHLIPFEFTVSLRPFKQSRTGLKWKQNEKALINIEKYPSKPKIQILGSGDISFWVNNKKFDLTNVGREIIIDSRLMEAYRIVDGIVETQDSKTKFLDFPELSLGENTFRWQGNVQEFNILPRWWTKV